MRIILNEKRHVEDMLLSPDKENVSGQNLWLVARYYYGLGCSKEKVRDLLEKFVIKNKPTANVVKLGSLLDKIVKGASKRKLLEIESIPITYAELEVVDALESKREQKILFTLICLAKYANEAGGNMSGWVNQSVKDIFSLANMHAMLKQNQYKLIHNLYVKDLIGFSKRVDNMNIQVKCLNYDSDPCLQIYDYRNLGNQYLRYKGEKFMECESCGLVVKRMSSRQKYCPDCAKEINNLNAKEHYKRVNV